MRRTYPPVCLQTLLVLAAEPMASLVDTVWVGRLGSPELAACAAALAVFNVVTKVHPWALRCGPRPAKQL